MPVKATPIRITSAAVVTTTATIELDQPVVLKGIPQYRFTDGGPVPTAASLTSPTTLVLTWAADPGDPTEILIPFEDPAIRNSVGGFVADSVVTL